MLLQHASRIALLYLCSIIYDHSTSWDMQISASILYYKILRMYSSIFCEFRLFCEFLVPPNLLTWEPLHLDGIDLSHRSDESYHFRSQIADKFQVSTPIDPKWLLTFLLWNQVSDRLNRQPIALWHSFLTARRLSWRKWVVHLDLAWEAVDLLLCFQSCMYRIISWRFPKLWTCPTSDGHSIGPEWDKSAFLGPTSYLNHWGMCPQQRVCA